MLSSRSKKTIKKLCLKLRTNSEKAFKIRVGSTNVHNSATCGVREKRAIN